MCSCQFCAQFIAQQSDQAIYSWWRFISQLPINRNKFQKVHNELYSCYFNFPFITKTDELSACFTYHLKLMKALKCKPLAQWTCVVRKQCSILWRSMIAVDECCLQHTNFTESYVLLVVGWWISLPSLISYTQSTCVYRMLIEVTCKLLSLCTAWRKIFKMYLWASARLSAHMHELWVE